MIGPFDREAEAACDRIVALCAELGLTRAAVASALLAVATNHAVASRIDGERWALAAREFHAWRANRGLEEHTLVPAMIVEPASFEELDGSQARRRSRPGEPG